jgi:hypothetical protein
MGTWFKSETGSKGLQRVLSTPDIVQRVLKSHSTHIL